MNIKENLNLGDIVMYMNNDELEVRGIIMRLYRQKFYRSTIKLYYI